MGAFRIYLELPETDNPDEDAAEILDRFVEEYEDVTYGPEEVGAKTGDGIVVPGAALDVDSIDDFADIYADLRDDPRVEDVLLWGPGAERFPVRIYHHALQQLSRPELYEFHAIDNRVTLVIAESEREARQAREDVGPGGLI